MFDPERDGLGGTAANDASVFSSLEGTEDLPPVSYTVTAVQPAPMDVPQTPATVPVARVPQAAPAMPVPAPSGGAKGFDKNTIALIAVLGLLYYLLTKVKR